MTTLSIPTPRDAEPGDRAAIERLLTDSALPTDGVRDALDNFLVVADGNAIIGVIGLELFGSDALLRSAAVASSSRNVGVGTVLTDAILERARTRGVRDLYLLTTTAEEYFARRGFVRITRDDVPATVRGSVEFTSACPASATVMVRVLDAHV